MQYVPLRLVASLTRHLFIGWAGVLLIGHLSYAQQNDPAAKGSAAKPAAEDGKETDPVREVEPTVIWSIDPDTGKWRVGVLNYTVDDLRKLIEQRGGVQPAPRPRGYVLEQLLLTGKTEGDAAVLTASLNIAKHDANWTRIPLGMSSAILPGPPEYEGPGKVVISRDEDDQLICWLQSEAETKHKLRLKLQTPLARVGGATRLQLAAPASTTSQLTLIVPQRVKVVVSDGGELLSTKQEGGPSTELTVHKLDGDFTLTWRPVKQPAAKVATALEVEGSVVVRIDPHFDNNIEADTTLRIKNSGAPLSQFRVRLPAGVDLVVERVSMDDGYDLEKMDADGRVWEIKPRQQVGEEAVVVTLPIQQSYERGQPIKLSGIEVLGAATHVGWIAMQVDGDYRVDLVKEAGVERVGLTQLPARIAQKLDGDGMVRAYRYFRPAFILTATVNDKQKRVKATPRYVYSIGADEIRLRADLKYFIHGPRVHEIRVDLPGWEIDLEKIRSITTGPDEEDVVRVSGIDVSDGVGVTIPLKTDMTGHLQIWLEAVLRTPADGQPLVLRLPQLRDVNHLEPAAMVLMPDDDVTLTPRVNETLGLSRRPAPPPIELESRQPPPLYYQADAADAALVADLKVHQQEVTAETSSEVTLADDGSGQVVQTLSYHVKYRAVTALSLDVPRVLIESPQLSISLDGKQLASQSLVFHDSVPGSPTVTLDVALPQAKIGLCHLVCRFPLPGATPVRAESVVLEIPLVMPAEPLPAANHLHLVTGPDIEIVDSGLPWELVETDDTDSAGNHRRRLFSDLAAPEARPVVRREARSSVGATVVERAWVQTWLSDNVRRERVVYRFTSQQPTLELSLPEGISEEVEKLRGELSVVQGDEVRTLQEDRITTTSNRTKLSVKLLSAATAAPRRYVLELYYQFPNRGPENQSGTGTLSIEVPRFHDAVWVERMYWELILPSNEHVVFEPSGMTQEYRWAWQPVFFGRQPLLDTAALEAWSGGSALGDTPSGSNRYLFSTKGNPGSYSLRTADRTSIVLMASAAVLMGGLLLIYVPSARHPGALFAVSVVLLAVCWRAPAPALLLAQATGIGLVLALLAAWLVHTAQARRARHAVVRGSSSSLLEVKSTEVQQPPPSNFHKVSTASTPAVLELPASDSR